MGQEFLEDKPWDVDPRGPNLLSWDGLDAASDSTMRDHLRFTKDLSGFGAICRRCGVTTSTRSINPTATG
jgi:hypothetical protein